MEYINNITNFGNSREVVSSERPVVNLQTDHKGKLCSPQVREETLQHDPVKNQEMRITNNLH